MYCGTVLYFTDCKPIVIGSLAVNTDQQVLHTTECQNIAVTRDITNIEHSAVTCECQ